MVGCNTKNSNRMSEISSDTVNVNLESISDDNSLYLLVGTYTSGESKGIYVYKFDTVSGYSKYKSMVKTDNPSYLTVSKDEKFVYAVSENNDNSAAACAFTFDKKDGTLKLLNSQKTDGADPCYIEIDDAGKHVITANYSGGNLSLFDTKEDGSLNTASQVIDFVGKGVNPERQDKPHIHCAKYSPDGKYLFVNDLGTDKMYKFDVNTKTTGSYLSQGNPSFVKVADGSGPRHLIFHPNGKYAYLINELSGTVDCFNYEESTGNLKIYQTIQADTLKAAGSADIHISPDGKFLYASNRLQGDGIAIFSINQMDGKLTKVAYQETGLHPRNFIITPNGKFLLVACRDSDAIQIFLRDAETGLLEDSYKEIELDMPVCLKFASFK
ncbi:MAG: lactonase family protein [Dysgonomonas sp.]